MGKATNSAVVADVLGLDLAGGVGEGEQHAVGAAVVQRFDRVAAGLLAQVELELRALPAQPRQDARQQERGDRRDHAHPQLARERLARGLDQVGQLLGLAQQAVRLGDHRVAERGEAHHPPAALDQRHAEQRFELADAGRQGRLRDEHRLGRAAEVAVFVERDEVLQLLDGGEVGAHSAAWSSLVVDQVERRAVLVVERPDRGRFGLGLRLAVDAGHLEAALLDAEPEPALDQLERVAAEHLVAPAFEHRQLAHAGGERLELLGAGQQPRGDVDLAGADLEQQLEQVGDERAFLAERRAALGLLGQLVVGQRLGVLRARASAACRCRCRATPG